MLQDKYFDIRTENVPAWYEIGFDDNNLSLLVFVHEAVIEKMMKVKSDHPEVIKVKGQESIILSEFTSDEINWGFGSVFKRVVSNRSSFVCFAVKIPQVLRPIDSKKSKFLPLNQQYDWRKSDEISASFQIFWRALHFSRPEEILWSDKRPQLMQIRSFITMRMMGACPIGATLSRSFVNWLIKFSPNEEILEATQSMRRTYSYLINGTQTTTRLSNTLVVIGSERCRLHLECPGDRSGLHPDYNVGFDIRNGHGYDLGDHNIDNSMQQITLLVGLAKLWDLCLEHNWRLI